MTRWYESGKKASEYTYKDGRKVGKAMSFYRGKTSYI